MEEHPVAWEDCCEEYWCEKTRKHMSRWTCHSDMTEKMLKTALSPNQSIWNMCNLKRYFLFVCLYVHVCMIFICNKDYIYILRVCTFQWDSTQLRFISDDVKLFHKNDFAHSVLQDFITLGSFPSKHISKRCLSTKYQINKQNSYWDSKENTLYWLWSILGTFLVCPKPTTVYIYISAI